MLSLLLLSGAGIWIFVEIRRKGLKKPFFEWVFFAVVILLVLESASYFFLVRLARQGGNFYLIGNQRILDRIARNAMQEKMSDAQDREGLTYIADPDLGWKVGRRKNYAGSLATNSQGVRALREYALFPDENVLRVAAFGDSFIFCDGEKTEDCWTYLLEGMHENLEVVNFGVSAYGLGQSYLRYLSEGLAFNPDIVIFNYILLGERDNLMAHEVLSGLPLTNANLYRLRFSFHDGTLHHPVTRVADWFNKKFRDEAIYSRLDPSAKSSFWRWPVFSVSNFGLLLKTRLAKNTYLKKISSNTNIDLIANFYILDTLIKTVRQQGGQLIFLYGVPSDGLPEFIKILLNRNQDVVTYVDLKTMLQKMAAERKYPRKTLMNDSAHFNRKGNMLYAQAVAAVLRSRVWSFSRGRMFRYSDRSKRFERQP